MHLSTLDFTVVAVYAIFLLVIAQWVSRERSGHKKDTKDYFLAGRTMKGWMTGTSYAVTCMNTDVAPAYCGMTVITGMFICWWYISRFGLALMIGGVLFAVFWRRLKIFTSPEFYEMLEENRGSTITVNVASGAMVRSSYHADLQANPLLNAD